jgi:hypothetical protein
MTDPALEKQVNKLWLSGEEQLYTTLGINQMAVEKAKESGDAQVLEKAQQYDARFAPEDTGMGALDVLKDVGQTWWVKFEPKIYDLVCNKKNPEHDKFLDAVGGSAKQLAMLLAPSLLASMAGAVPAVVVVVATIAAKKIADSGLEAMCEVWAEARAEKAEEEEGGSG